MGDEFPMRCENCDQGVVVKIRGGGDMVPPLVLCEGCDHLMDWHPAPSLRGVLG